MAGKKRDCGALTFRGNPIHAMCDIPTCHASGVWCVTMAGHPAGAVCEKHRREYKNAWTGNRVAAPSGVATGWHATPGRDALDEAA